MKLGFSTNAFSEYDLDIAIESISNLGFTGIELVVDSPHLFLPISQNQIMKIKYNLNKYNLQVANLNSNTTSGFTNISNPFEPSISSTDDKLRKWRLSYTKQVIDFAVLIGSSSICITSGIDLLQTHSTQLKIFEDSLIYLGDYAEQKKIKLAIEYEPGLLINNSNDVWRLISKDFKNIGLNLDTCHAEINSENISEIILKFNKKIFHTHISDCKNKIHYHLIPGLGEIDFKKMILSLKKINYRGFLTAELYPYNKNPIDAASKAFIYLKNLI